jgi:hypothetical protein
MEREKRKAGPAIPNFCENGEGEEKGRHSIPQFKR